MNKDIQDADQRRYSVYKFTVNFVFFASGLLPDMKLGFLGKLHSYFIYSKITKIHLLALAVIIWTSKSLQFSHFKQETDSRNYPIKDEDVLQKDVSKNVQKAKVHELLLPIKSSSMLKDLFHFPVFVTYKRSDENFEGYNPHVRVIKRSQDFEEDPQIRVMRFDPGMKALNHLSALDRHIR